MKHFGWAIAMLFVASAPFSFADSTKNFTITQTTISVRPDSDNVTLLSRVVRATSLPDSEGSTASKVGVSFKVLIREVLLV